MQANKLTNKPTNQQTNKQTKMSLLQIYMRILISFHSIAKHYAKMSLSAMKVQTWFYKQGIALQQYPPF